MEECDLLWVDAICINQKDDEERAAQVQRMGLIFSSAQCVLAWLGPEEDNSTEVVLIIKALAAEIRRGENIPGVEILSLPPTQELREHLNLDVMETTMLSLLLKRQDDFLLLFRGRDFWHRCWILQEVVLARDIKFFCGRATFNYPEIQYNEVWIDSLSPEDLAWDEWLLLKRAFAERVEKPMESCALILQNQDIEIQPYDRAWYVPNKHIVSRQRIPVTTSSVCLD